MQCKKKHVFRHVNFMSFKYVDLRRRADSQEEGEKEEKSGKE